MTSIPVATEQEILDAASDALLDLVSNPKKVTTDAGSIEEHPIGEVLAAKKQAAADVAVGASPTFGTRIRRIRHGATTD